MKTFLQLVGIAVFVVGVCVALSMLSGCLANYGYLYCSLYVKGGWAWGM